MKRSTFSGIVKQLGLSAGVCLLVSSCGRAPQPSSSVAGEDLKVAIIPKTGVVEGDPIPAGTEIHVRPSSAISSRTVSAGESIPVTVAAPVLIKGETRVHEGAEAIVSVIDSDAGTTAGSQPSLTLRLREIRFGIVDRAELHTAPLVVKGAASAEIAAVGPVARVPTTGVEIGTGTTLTFKLESTATIPSRRR